MLGRRKKFLIFLMFSTLTIAGTVPVVERTPPVQTSPSKVKQPVWVLQTPDEAVAMALADLLTTVQPRHYCYTRYIWVQDGDTRSMKTTSLALGYLTRGTTIQKPFPVPVSSGHLLRINLEQYTFQEKDLEEWVRFWEEFKFDPRFAKLVTQDIVDKQVAREVKHKVYEAGPLRNETRIIQHPGGEFIYPDDSGRKHIELAAGKYEVDLVFKSAPVEKEVTETVKETLPGGVAVLRFNPNHINQQAFRTLQELTRSAAPVVEHTYFKIRSLAAIKTADPKNIKNGQVFKAVYGGLYYEFRGIKRAKDVLGADTKATDLDLYFETLGLGNIKGGLTAEQLFEKLPADQRVAMRRSQVTGRPREVSMFRSPADQEGAGWGAITGDVKQEDIDIGDDPLANLLNPRRKARETIYPRIPGFHDFGAWNDKGERQDEVPFDIAIDTTIPNPHPKRLTPAISCIRCHQDEGSDGWKPLVNDVKKKLEANTIDILGDFGAGRRLAFDTKTNARLLGLYGGDFTKNIRRARDDLAEVTLKATGPWKGTGRGDQADVVKIAAQRLEDEYNGYMYDLVGPQRALRELGVDVQSKDALELFKRLVPPYLPPGWTPNDDVLEDPRVADLRANIPINRSDWDLVYADVAERAQKALKRGVKIK